MLSFTLYQKLTVLGASVYDEQLGNGIKEIKILAHLCTFSVLTYAFGLSEHLIK